MSAASESKYIEMISLAHTLPSLAIAQLWLPYPITQQDFDALIAAIESWRHALLATPTKDSGE